MATYSNFFFYFFIFLMNISYLLGLKDTFGANLEKFKKIEEKLQKLKKNPSKDLKNLQEEEFSRRTTKKHYGR